MAHDGNWYVLQSGRWVGPMPAAQVQGLANSGRLAPADLVAQEGMPSGMTAADAGFVAGAAGGAAPSADLASRWQRLGAALADGVIGVAVMTPGIVLLTVAGVAGDDSRGAPLALGVATLLLLTVLLAIYQIYSLTTAGQTLGKRLLKIRIVRAEDDGPAGFVRAVAIRLLLNGALGVGGIYGIVDLLFIFGERRECLHDRIARTKVVTA